MSDIANALAVGSLALLKFNVNVGAGTVTIAYNGTTYKTISQANSWRQWFFYTDSTLGLCFVDQNGEEGTTYGLLKTNNDLKIQLGTGSGTEAGAIILIGEGDIRAGSVKSPININIGANTDYKKITAYANIFISTTAFTMNTP